MKKLTYHVYCGTIYNDETGIENPAVAISDMVGTFRIGEKEAVEKAFIKRQKDIELLGFEDQIYLLVFDKEAMPVEEICEEMNNLLNNFEYGITLLKKFGLIHEPNISKLKENII